MKIKGERKDAKKFGHELNTYWNNGRRLNSRLRGKGRRRSSSFPWISSVATAVPVGFNKRRLKEATKRVKLMGDF